MKHACMVEVKWVLETHHYVYGWCLFYAFEFSAFRKRIPEVMKHGHQGSRTVFAVFEEFKNPS